MADISEHQHEQFLSTQKCLALLDMHFWELTRSFQGWDTKRSKSPYLFLSVLSFSSGHEAGQDFMQNHARSSTEMLLKRGRLESRTSLETEGHAHQESGCKHRQAPKEPRGARGHPRGQPAPTARSVWLPPPWPRPPDQRGKNLIWPQHGEEPKSGWPSWRFCLQWGSRWPRSPELSRESFSWLSELLFPPSSRNQAAFVRMGVLLRRPKTMSFALCRYKPSVQNYGQMNTDLHWYSNGITGLFSQISNEHIWATLFDLVLKLTPTESEIYFALLFYASGMYICV